MDAGRIQQGDVFGEHDRGEMRNIESAIVDFEKGLAQHTSRQGGGCVIFNVLSVEDCIVSQETSFLVKDSGAFIRAPAAAQGLFFKEVSNE